MKDKYNPEVGEIWYFATDKRHYCFESKKEPPENYSIYSWEYEIYCLETGRHEKILHGNMNSYGEGWFRKIQ